MSSESAWSKKGPESYFPAIEKTYGKPISRWLNLLDAMTEKTHMEKVEVLKTSHKLGHGHANALVAYRKARK